MHRVRFRFISEPMPSKKGGAKNLVVLVPKYPLIGGNFRTTRNPPDPVVQKSIAEPFRNHRHHTPFFYCRCIFPLLVMTHCSLPPISRACAYPLATSAQAPVRTLLLWILAALAMELTPWGMSFSVAKMRC